MRVHFLGGNPLGTLAVLPALVGIGAISGVLAVRSGELSQSILLHMGFNLLAVLGAAALLELTPRPRIDFSPGPKCRHLAPAQDNLFSGGMEWRHAQDVRKRRQSRSACGSADATSCSTAAPKCEANTWEDRATS